MTSQLVANHSQSTNHRGSNNSGSVTKISNSKMRLLACALLVVSVASVAKAASWQSALSDILQKDNREIKQIEENCVPRETFKYYCNTCYCVSGSVAACTRAYCDPEVWNKDGSRKNFDGAADKSLLRETRQVEETEEKCKPGDLFMDYCNQCFCLDSGVPACTRMYCDTEHWNKDGSRKNSKGAADKSLLREKRHVQKTEEKCKPGAHFMDYCNHCVCLNSGLPACTRMHCDPEYWNKDGSRKGHKKAANKFFLRQRRDVEEADEKCEPGAVFRNYCNYCFCLDNGSPACTKMYCDHEDWNKNGTQKTHSPTAEERAASKVFLRQTRDVEEADDKCEPGAVFRNYCNYCFCLDNGSPACTKMYCDHEDWNKNGTQKTHSPTAEERAASKVFLRQTRDVEEADEKCEPGAVFRNYCNYCFCLDNGSPACTKMYCDHEDWNKNGTQKTHSPTAEERAASKVFLRQTRDVDEADEKCEPGAVFRNYCNYCFCLENGSPACTKMYCDHEDWNKNGTQKTHSPTAEERAASKVFLRQTRDVEEADEKCEPGAVFRNYCNYCFCLDNGSPACTKMYCDHEDWNKNGTQKTHSPTAEERAASKVFLRQTRDVEEADDKCEPGAVFRNYCNYCFCLDNGSPACTKMYCDHEDWNKNGTQKTHSPTAEERAASKVLLRKTREVLNTEDQCKPGTSFKKYCNYCYCLDNGTHACTQMFCDSEEWNEDGSRKSHE